MLTNYIALILINVESFETHLCSKAMRFTCNTVCNLEIFNRIQLNVLGKLKGWLLQSNWYIKDSRAYDEK